VVCLQTSDGLVAADPLTGGTLWTRSDIAPNSRLFGDDETVFVVEMDRDARPATTRALRLTDGSAIRVAAFADLYAKRLRALGHQILLSERGEGGGVTLRLYDVRAGKDVWKETYPANSDVLRSQESSLAGVVTPDGTVHVVDLDARKEVLTSKVDPKHLDKVESVHLLADRWNLYVICNGPADPNLMPWGGVQTNLMPGTGLRGLPVNGQVYAFERARGKARWHNEVRNQMLVLNDFNGIPLVLFTARYQRWIKMGPGRAVQQVISVMAFAKRTGKRLYDTESGPQQKMQMQFHALNVNPDKGWIDFVNANMKIRFTAEDGKPAPPK
jgi:outer membrane protein assembly factor BamB